MATQKAIKITVTGADTLPLDKLEPFQGDLKTLAKEQYEKMRENILANGFSFVVHVWKNKGKNFIIDGHQRVFTVKQLVEVEGYRCPSLPVAFIKADSYKEAKMKILAGASAYGRITDKGLESFLREADLNIESVAGQFDFQGVDFESFYKNFMELKNDIILPEPEDYTGTGMASSSAQVKQVQLLFSTDSYEDFAKKTELLAKIYKTENITDTIIEAVREAHKVNKAKS